MSDHAFRSLINLVQFDKDIYKIKKDIAALQKEVAQSTERERQLLQELEHSKQQVHDWRKKVDEQELEMKSLDAKEKETSKKLETAASQKEYKALKAEIDHLKQAQHDFEQEVMVAWNKLESAEKELQDKQVVIDENLVAVRANIEQKKEQIKTLDFDLSERLQQRAEKEKLVPEEWLEKYAAMGSRVPDPVVPVLNSSCSACSFAITNQDILRLKRGALLQCKGCFRFLYVPEVMQAEEKEEQAIKTEEDTKA